MVPITGWGIDPRFRLEFRLQSLIWDFSGSRPQGSSWEVLGPSLEVPCPVFLEAGVILGVYWGSMGIMEKKMETL